MSNSWRENCDGECGFYSMSHVYPLNPNAFSSHGKISHTSCPVEELRRSQTGQRRCSTKLTRHRLPHRVFHTRSFMGCFSTWPSPDAIGFVCVVGALCGALASKPWLLLRGCSAPLISARKHLRSDETPEMSRGGAPGQGHQHQISTTPEICSTPFVRSESLKGQLMDIPC